MPTDPQTGRTIPEIKLCPFCGEPPKPHPNDANLVLCGAHCPAGGRYVTRDRWNLRAAPPATDGWRSDATVQEAVAKVVADSGHNFCTGFHCSFQDKLDALCDAVASCSGPRPALSRETCQQYTETWLHSKSSVTRLEAEVVRDLAADYDLYVAGLARLAASSTSPEQNNG